MSLLSGATVAVLCFVKTKGSEQVWRNKNLCVKFEFEYKRNWKKVSIEEVFFFLCAYER